MPKKRTRRDEEALLTPRQLDILRFVQQYRDSRGCSPTLQEIASHFRRSKVTVFEHVEALVKAGLLRREPNKARSLRLTETAKRIPGPVAPAGPGVPIHAPHSPVACPLAGTIAAGRPVEAAQDHEVLDLADLFPRNEPVFALQVRGDSMIDEQIRQGDYVLVRQTDRPEPGRIVVALLDNGETTLKKLYRQGQGFRLVAANPDYPDIYTENLRIQGIVIGVIRQC